MTFVRRILVQPQRLWIRRALLQVHLWTGVILGLYLCLIAITGSLLVFRVEMEHRAATLWPNIKPASPSGTGLAPLTTVINNVQAAYPNDTLVIAYTPTRITPVFRAEVQSRRRRFTVVAHPETGALLGEMPERRTWIDTLADLHTTLLFGVKGRMANGIGGAFLLLMTATGILLWWPGIRTWTKALFVDPRRGWRRINFDLHRATGFWVLLIISFWAASGVYFGFSREVFQFVNRLSPVVTARPPTVKLGPVTQPVPLDLDSLIARSEALDPGTTLAGVRFPYSRRAPIEILRLRPGGYGWDYTNTLYFNPYDSTHIQTWRYGVNQTLGDWFIWLQVPLHYGVFWGLGFKILWASLGLAIPLLVVTGATMYWNRIWRHRVKRWSART